MRVYAHHGDGKPEGVVLELLGGEGDAGEDQEWGEGGGGVAGFEQGRWVQWWRVWGRGQRGGWW